MKKEIIFSLLLSFVMFSGNGQERQTIVGTSIKKVGIVGGFNGGYSGLNSKFLPTAQSYFGLVFNEKFILGLSSLGTADPNKTVGSINNKSMAGGLYAEYILNPHKAVHVSFPLVIGLGVTSSDTIKSIGFDRFRGKNGRGGDFRGYRRNATEFGLVQPGMNVEFNILKNLSLVTGINYKLGLGAKNGSLTSSEVSGLGLHAGLRVGIYNIKAPKKTNRKQSFKSKRRNRDSY